MLLPREFVTYLSRQIVRRLSPGTIETQSPEKVVELTGQLRDMGVYQVSISDTIGVANPQQVEDVMVRVIAKLHHSTLRRSTLDATSRYWHFMGVLWLYLLLLLWMKL